MDLVDFGRRNAMSQRPASHMPLSPTPAPDSGNQLVLSQYHFRILIPQSAFKHTSQSLNHYKDRREHASHMHAFNSMKVARKRQTLGQLNIAFHSHVSVGDAHVIKGTTFLWEANEEGDKFIKETRQCHISATSENSLLPWPSGSLGLYLQRLVIGPSRTKRRASLHTSQEELTQKTW